MENKDDTSRNRDNSSQGNKVPHIRQRLYWVADSSDLRRGRRNQYGERKGIETTERSSPNTGSVGNTSNARLQGHGELRQQYCSQGREDSERFSATPSATNNVGDTTTERLSERSSQALSGEETCSVNQRPSATNGFWANCDWLPCKDNKARAVEPGTFPLVDGAPNRVGRLRGYGNSIVAPQAEAFIKAYRDIMR